MADLALHRPTCPECGQLADAVEASVVVETRAGQWRESVRAADEREQLQPHYTCANGHWFTEAGEPYRSPTTIRKHYEPEGLRG